MRWIGRLMGFPARASARLINLGPYNSLGNPAWSRTATSTAFIAVNAAISYSPTRNIVRALVSSSEVDVESASRGLIGEEAIGVFDRLVASRGDDVRGGVRVLMVGHDKPVRVEPLPGFRRGDHSRRSARQTGAFRDSMKL